MVDYLVVCPYIQWNIDGITYSCGNIEGKYIISQHISIGLLDFISVFQIAVL